MIIEQEDFRMESSSTFEPLWFWDLYLLKVINEGKDNARSEIKWDGWGCPTTCCMERIATSRTNSKIKSKLDDRTFKEIFEEELNIIKNYLSTFPNIRIEKPVWK